MLIAAARENNIEVIYVRHDDGAGAEGQQLLSDCRQITVLMQQLSVDLSMVLK